MYKRGIMLRSLSMVLTAAMLATALPQTGMDAAATESIVVEAESVDITDPIDDVSDGDIVIVEEPGETQKPVIANEPGITVSSGDVSEGNIPEKTVSDGNDGQEETEITVEAATVVATKTINGCTWTLDSDGVLTIRDSEEANTETGDWGFSSYKSRIKSVDMDITKGVKLEAMFENLSNLETAVVKIDECDESLKEMFSLCKALTSLDVSGLNTQNVKNMSGMFSYCESLQNLDLSNLNTQNVTDMSSMFYYCLKLENLDLTNLNTENVQNMSKMFSIVPSVQNLNLSSFDTKNVTDMSSMFNNCSSVTSLDVSNFNTSKVTTMASMFSTCSNLTDLDVSSFDTSNVTNMAGMFGSCKKLTSLEITNFDTSNVTNMSAMFGYCSGLSSLNLSNFNTEKVTEMQGLFSSCSNLVNLDISKFNTANVIDMGAMFSNCSRLVSLDLRHFNTAKVTEMDNMFYKCTALKYVDLSSFDTKNVTTMSYMFSQCSALTTLDLSGFDFGKLEKTYLIFGTSSKIAKLKVMPNLTVSVSLPSTMYDEAGKSYTTFPQGLKESVWLYKTKPKVIRSGTNNGCSWTLDNLGVLKIRDSKSGSGESGKWPWRENYNYYYNKITSVDMDVTKCANLEEMFSNLTYLESATIKIGKSEGSAKNMFFACSQLVSLDITGFNTSGITDMTSMFRGCSKLQSLDISNFDTSKVTSMQVMFRECYKLENLDVSGFDTKNVKDMSGMFLDCSKLKSLDVSNFNTQNVTDMENMFYYCAELKSLDVSKFITKNTTNMYGMFGSCSGLTSLDVSGFDTGNVTTMGEMFIGCSGLTGLDVSNFNLSNVKDTSYMFYYCTNLECLDLSNFDMTNVTYTEEMFGECDNLTLIKTCPNLKVATSLPAEMYDHAGNSYTEFPQGLQKGIWLACNQEDIALLFEKLEYKVLLGNNLQVNLENVPAGLEASQFTLTSSDPEVLIVDETGFATAVAPGTVTVSATYGDYQCTCKVVVIDRGFYVKDIQDVIYTGTAIKPEVLVYDSTKRLTEGVDYTIAYTSNTAAADKNSKNAPKVTVTGKGNYSGKVVATFTILPYDVKEGGVSVSLPQSVLTANNKVQKPAPVVTFNGKKLTANKDYTVSYPQLSEEGAYKNPGTYEVQVTFKNNFTGSETVSVEIKEGTAISKVKVGAIAKQPYTGSAIEPKPVITMGKETLVEGTHYSISYVNNILPGKATVKITGMGEYAGEKTVTFEITGTSISKAQVTGLADKTYNGKIQLQDLKVSLDNGTTFLTEGVDYKVVYEKNLNVGTAKVKIIGAGGYVGTVSKSFRITPYNIETDEDNALSGIPENLVVSYMKGGCKPELTLMFHEYRMDQKKECTISYSNNAKLGNASDGKKAPTITIKGKGNFTGTKTIQFSIVESNLTAEDTSVTLSAADIAFVNKAGNYVSAPVLTESNGKKLAAGTDYDKTIVYTMNGQVLDPKKDVVPVGSEVTVTVTGKGCYTGTMSATYRITEKSFKSVKIIIDKQTYTGKPIQLKAKDIKVVNGKDTLVYGVDYEIVEDSYVNNVVKGNASVTIKGKGNYGGMKTVKFAIIPKGIN